MNIGKSLKGSIFFLLSIFSGYHCHQKSNMIRFEVQDLEAGGLNEDREEEKKRQQSMTMSKTTAEVDSSSEATKEAGVCCASCGIAGVDNNESEECTECHSARARYCSDNCREEHREQHEEECKECADELRDKNLFRQPDSSHLGECPICFLPLPLDMRKCMFWPCCSKVICKGCVYANCNSIGDHICSFCREPVARGNKKGRKRVMKRIKANDPTALSQMGARCYEGGDYDDALEYLTKAAELGDWNAHYHLGLMYWKGYGVEKDEEKAVYHYEKAAIGGHHYARYNLGYIEENNGWVERSVKHFIIAANIGYEPSMKALWTHYSLGNITKEDLEATLRTHQAAIDEMKSSDRDAGEIASKELRFLC